MMRARALLPAAVLCLAVLPAAATGQVASGLAVQGELWFDAKATLGPFRGVTRTVRGAMTGGATLQEVQGWVEFSVADLTTNNGMRDRDMRSSLEASKFPLIRFDLDSVRVVDGVPGADSLTVELAGRMQIHGVTRPLRVPSLVRRAGELYRATGDFDLFVPDYGIRGLRKMFGMLSMDETVRVGFDVTFNTARGGAEE